MLNHLFHHPHTKIEYLQEALRISRPTAAGYLNQLAKDGVLIKKVSKPNYYINLYLTKALPIEYRNNGLGKVAIERKARVDC